MEGLVMRYFVLKPEGNGDHEFASRMALRAYAANIKGINSELARDLTKWVEDIEQALKGVCPICLEEKPIDDLHRNCGK